ncbi:MAG: hypothetical protein RR636_11140 [Clostridium sp.]|uniref:hypothetical protein n=1 Tax=Clostridium sp. TaxID=1506 RepID=UPI00302E1121
MKKFDIILLILITLVFSTFIATPAFAANTFKEGVYKSADFNFSPHETYIVQNISPNDSAYLTLYDENQLIIQSIRLEPKSAKYNLIPLKPDYRIVIVGNGEIYIDTGTQ